MKKLQTVDWPHFIKLQYIRQFRQDQNSEVNQQTVVDHTKDETRNRGVEKFNKSFITFENQKLEVIFNI